MLLNPRLNFVSCSCAVIIINYILFAVVNYISYNAINYFENKPWLRDKCIISQKNIFFILNYNFVYQFHFELMLQSAFFHSNNYKHIYSFKMEASFTVIRLHVLLEYYSLTHWIEKVSFMHPSIYACNAAGSTNTSSAGHHTGHKRKH